MNKRPHISPLDSISNMHDSQIQMMYLPDTMANWPWPRAISPHHEEVKAESDVWFESFKAHNPRSQLATNKAKFGRRLLSMFDGLFLTSFQIALLAALVYPHVSKGIYYVMWFLLSKMLILNHQSTSAPDAT